MLDFIFRHRLMVALLVLFVINALVTYYLPEHKGVGVIMATLTDAVWLTTRPE